MATWRPLDSSEPGLILRLDDFEVQLLVSLAAQLVDLVESPDDPNADPLAALVGITPHAEAPDDPALLRLLPDAFADDPEHAAEFRRFTDRDLRESKVRHAEQVRAGLEAASDEGEVPLSGESMAAWLGFLNDIRLVLGVRLEVTEDNQDELANLSDDDPRSSLFGIYGWLTYVQETLVQVLLGDLE